MDHVSTANKEKKPKQSVTFWKKSRNVFNYRKCKQKRWHWLLAWCRFAQGSPWWCVGWSLELPEFLGRSCWWRFTLRRSLDVNGGDGGHVAALKQALGVRRLIVTVQFASQKMLTEALRSGRSTALARALLKTGLGAWVQTTIKKKQLNHTVSFHKKQKWRKLENLVLSYAVMKCVWVIIREILWHGIYV